METNNNNKRNAVVDNIKKSAEKIVQTVTNQPRDVKIILQKYTVLIIFCITVATYFYYFDKNPDFLQSNTFVYSMTILVPIFVYSIVIYGSRFFTPENQFYIFSSVGVALFVIIFIGSPLIIFFLIALFIIFANNFS